MGIVQSTVSEGTAYLAIIFMLLFFGTFFAEIKGDVDGETKEIFEKVETNTYQSFKTILWGLGIIGPIGTALLIYHSFAENSGGAI